MAAIVNGNTIYVVPADADSSPLPGQNVLLMGIILNTESGTSSIELGDDISGTIAYPTKVVYQAAANSVYFHDYSNYPILFPKGIRIKTISGNITVTLIIRRSNG